MTASGCPRSSTRCASTTRSWRCSSRSSARSRTARDRLDQKGTFAFQRDLLKHHVRTYIKKPWLSGAIAWVLRDFRSRPDWEGGNPTPRPGWNQKGLLDYRSRKKPVFDPLAQLYKSVPPVAARPYPFGTSR